MRSPRGHGEVTALYWVVDSNGTTVSSGDTLNDYWTLVRVSIVNVVDIARPPSICRHFMTRKAAESKYSEK